MEIMQRSNLSSPKTTIDDDLDYFPDWLLFEILLRLPLNSVFKCRIVSKRWLSVASSPYFIRAYACRASSSWIVLPRTVWKYDKIRPALVHWNNLIEQELHLHPPQLPNLWKTEIKGATDDGLVLYSTYSGDFEFHLYVCNPITGDRAGPLPFPAPDGCVYLGSGFLTRVDEEFTLKSYRIVLAMQRPDDPTAIIFNVYHSEIGDWRKFVANGPGPDHVDLQTSPAVLDGVLYWDDLGNYVIAYDPEAKPERQVLFIRDPLGEEKDPELYNYLCVACRGELRYFGGCEFGDDGIPEFSVWRLEDMSSGEWCLVHKAGKTYIRRALGMHNALQIVCFDPFDPDVVYLSDRHTRSAFSYSLRDGTLDDCREMVVDADGHFSKIIYSFLMKSLLLVVPPWPVAIGEKHLERRRRDRY